MTNNIPTRVAELSATLTPIKNALTFLHLSEVMGIADDFINYNSPYYCNGIQRVEFEDTIISCIFDVAEDYQVLRYFATHVYNDGEGTYQYYVNEREHEDEDDYMDNGDYDNELDVDESIEYKQIWMDRKGHTTTIILNDNNKCRETKVFCSVRTQQNWLTNHQASLFLLSNIDEYDDYCHTYPEDNEIVLNDIRNQFIQRARKFNAEFVNEIVSHGMMDGFIHFYRTFQILSKHRIELPKGYTNIRTYFHCLENLERDGVCLTEPAFIVPSELIANYNAEQDRLAKERKERERLKAIDEERYFNREHAYLFGIEFDDDKFHYKSLDSVEAYRIEGKIMHHCIFMCQYYNKHDVLSMHITDHEGNRVATCSINVIKGNIVELQTMCNDPEWRKGNEYKAIWNTLMARMHTFPRKQKEQTKKLVCVA